MRIMHIGNVQLRANGVGQVITALSEAQRNIGHEVVTLTARHKEDELDEYIEVHDSRTFSELLDNFKPEIFVFHSLFIWEYIRFYKILKKRKIPFLIQLHGALSEENYRKSHIKKVLALKLFYEKFIRSAIRIIYLNNGELGKSIVKRINQKSIIIPNGCCLPKKRPQLKDNPNDKIEFLYLGRIEIHHKALDILVQAIELVKQSDISEKVHFSFYGIGADEHILRFKEMIKKLGDVAEFRGPVYGDDKNKVYEESDIFLLTSRSEGMPMSVLEALTHGKPCLLTHATNMTDIIKDYDCGYICDIEPVQIANTIKRAVEEFEEKKKVMFNNSLVAANAYEWDKIAQKSIEMYKDILKDKYK